jgi:hypothetical protein
MMAVFAPRVGGCHSLTVAMPKSKSVQPGLAHSLNSQLSTLNDQLALGGRRGRAKQLRVESG